MNIYVIIFGVMLFSLIIQKTLESKIVKYRKVALHMSGAQIAEKMLRENGVTGVQITCIPGQLTDHFNPETMTVNLSEANYHGNNLAAAAIACHECGHALQHSMGYAPLRMRSALVPVVSFASNMVQWVLLLGVLLLQLTPALLWVGIVLFAVTTLFSFITLPVEINASSRAVAWLEDAGLTDYETSPMAADALKWAAYTYVIAALGSLATLLYYISLANSRER